MKVKIIGGEELHGNITAIGGQSFRLRPDNATAETEIAAKFAEASMMYVNNPTALHLRAMNMLYEGLKEKGALMLVPSSAVESMGMGGLMGAAALQQQRLAGGGDSNVK